MIPLHVRFHGPQPSPFYVGDEGRNDRAWRRMTSVEESRASTGVDHHSGSRHVGVSVTNRPNNRVVIAFDLIRLNLTLTAHAIKRLADRWNVEVATLERRLRNKAHFSKSFCEVPTTRERVEAWKQLIKDVLTNETSYVQSDVSKTINGDEHEQPQPRPCQ